MRAAGKFVSESKFLEKPSAFIPHILDPNPGALEALITKPEVERRLLRRLRKKAAQYAVDFGPEGEPLPVERNGAGAPVANGVGKITTRGKEDVEGVVEYLYENHVIPLTKEVEVSRAGAVLPVRPDPTTDCAPLGRWTTYCTVWMVYLRKK